MRQVVVTTGPWTGRWAPDLAAHVAAQKLVLTWYRPRCDLAPYAVDRFPVFIRDTDGPQATDPTLDGGSVKVAPHASYGELEDADDLDRNVTAHDLEPINAAVERYLPGLAPTPVRVAAYMDAYTTDGHAMVGGMPGVPRTWLLGGFSGHGFKMAPASVRWPPSSCSTRRPGSRSSTSTRRASSPSLRRPRGLRAPDPGLVGLLVGRLLLALPLGLDAAQVVVDLVLETVVVPAELGGHQLGRDPGRGGAAVEGLDGDAGTPGQHVVEVTSTLVRDRVDNLGKQVVLGARQRLGQVGTARDQREHLVDETAEPPSRWSIAGDVEAAGPSEGDPLVGARLEPAGAEQRYPVGDALPGSCVEPLRRRVDGVLRHHPVGGQLAAGDHHQSGERSRDGVLARDLRGRLGGALEQGSQAGVHPLDVVVVERRAQQLVDVLEHVVDVGAATPPGARGRGPTGCRWCR